MRYTGLMILLTLFLLFGCSSGETENLNSTSDETVSGSGSTEIEGQTAEENLRTVVINASSDEEVEVQVEIADDSAEQAQGLMNRTSLGEDRGMLFVFDNESTRSFWMKNTLIPLSIAYIDTEGRIVDIQKMKPEGGNQTVLDARLPRYVSAEPAQYALEVNRGFFEERGVEVGDTVRLPV